ncbi:MAG TPA: serine/threonine-protein kinase, partial [Ktedonobacteraceae bacterium]|nr:serine/threonine-protein kinase [Ktedonobacteraceae bacterium]
FGNYELVKRIDVGGMGEVYLAHQLTAFGRKVAIKIIRSDLVHDITARARFLREAEVSAHLKHEHILPLYDFGEVEGRLFLVTPYIEGGTLAARLKSQGTLSLSETQKLFTPLVQAVAYIHRRGVIHRDLKPTNIMLDMEDGEVYIRLIDFGIASLQGHSASPPLTMAGHEIGTVAYMAPERLSGIAAPSNDIFSLGVILHQMLTGQMPSTTASASARLPEVLAHVVRSCIAPNPADRYATAEDLLKSFGQACQFMQDQSLPGSLPALPGTSALATNRLTNDEQQEMEPLFPLSRPVSTARPASTSKPEAKSLANSGTLPPTAQGKSVPPTPRSSQQGHFTAEDYNAPTTSFAVSQEYKAPHISRPPLLKPRPPRPPQEKRSRLLLVLFSASMLILLLIGILLFYGYRAATAASVSINFAPRLRALSQVVSLKADPHIKQPDLNQAIIPGLVFSTTKTGQKSAATTGQINCIPFIGCDRGVSQDDENNLVDQLESTLRPEIISTLQGMISNARGTQVGPISISTQKRTTTPPVNSPGETVSVTLVQQGQVGYILDDHVKQVARQKLKTAVAQLGPGFQMIDSSFTIGHLVISNIDQQSGQVNIKIAAGAIARYQFTQDELQKLSTELVNKPLNAATALLKNQPGIDPASVSIHFSSGDGKTMPDSVQRINLIPLEPGAAPSIHLTPLPTSKVPNS